jgi:vanillate O-demethylase monooxygenase subunit
MESLPMTYLRNCWYVAAWGTELADVPIARRLLDQPVVLFRDADGTAHALADRCPHRFAPLSRGHIREGALECSYHGLRFDGSGACVRNPHGPVTRGLAVTAYPLAEVHRALWIWMGDPALADLTRIPDLAFLDAAPATASSEGYLNGAGNYELFVDNILDLTHIDYLHPTTLGSGAKTRTRAKVTESDKTVVVRWDMFDEEPAPFIASRLPPGVDRVDSFTEVTWFPAAVMTLGSGSVAAGRSMAEAAIHTNVHIMTPETRARTHYFYAATRNFAQDDVELNAHITRLRSEIFATEDEPMIGAQQQAMGGADFWELAPQLLRTDEGSVRVRRKLEKLIHAEHAVG